VKLMTNAEVPRSKIELLPPERESLEPFLEQLSEWMDSKFEIPGLNVRFGLDALLGLVPGLGDGLAFLISCYIIAAANHLGVPRITIARMGLNVAIDLVVGAVPLIGDLFDVAWKANTRNVELLRRTLEMSPGQRRRATLMDWLFVGGGMVGLFIALVTIAYVTWSALSWLFGGLTRS
jgi:hypothetical protein